MQLAPEICTLYVLFMSFLPNFMGKNNNNNKNFKKASYQEPPSAAANILTTYSNHSNILNQMQLP